MARSDFRNGGANLPVCRDKQQVVAPWSDTKSFSVTVVPRPLIAGIGVNNGVVTVAWNSLIGQA